MLHLYASETAALASLILFVALLAVLWFFRVGWSREATYADIIVLILSCAFGCRLSAKGKLCQWPANVDYTGRVALVVGASSGVGFSTAMQLAEHGWTVILAGRNDARLVFAKKVITRHLQRCGAKGQVRVMNTVDLRSDASIRSFVKGLAEVKEKMPVGLLVMAAGALHRHLRFVGEEPELKSGIHGVDKSPASWRSLESMVAANAVGPFLFTQLMLPLLEETAERTSVTSRIVNVGSSCHSFLGVGRQARFDPIAMLRGLDRRGADVLGGRRGAVAGASESSESDAYYVTDFRFSNFVGYYGLSKLCVMWNTRLLAQQVAMLRFTKQTAQPSMTLRKAETAEGEEGEKADGASASAPVADAEGEREHQLKIFVACVHPGIASTYLYRELVSPRVLDWLLYYPSLVIGKTWFEAAQSTLKAAVEDTDMVQGGYYLCGGEYGPQSGVNCVSAHAQSPTNLKAYREWLMGKVSPST